MTMRAALIVAGAVLAYATSTFLSTSATLAAGRSVQQSERGEQLVNGSCTGCHDLRPIQTQALDQESWTSTVQTMIEKGAKVSPDDIPIVVEYLVRNHGPLPDGPGKKIVLNTCTVCHDLRRVREHGATPEDWQETLIAMLNEGAALSDDDFPVVLGYLARNFKPQ
jgi:mono/diheme cytochrome c family protein